jgi:hypothetical protein
MRSRSAWAGLPAVLATALSTAAAACSSAPPPAPATPQRTTCGEVLSLALPPAFTCTPHPTTQLVTALVDGPHVRIELMASPHLAPGDSGTDRPLRQGERLHPLSMNGLSASAIVVPGGLWESMLTAWVPDVGNGGDKLAAVARWQAEADEPTAVAIIESVRVMRGPLTPPANPPDPAAAAAATAAGVPAAAGADPPLWLRHLVAFQLSIPAPPDMTVATHDPSQGANLSLEGKTFEVHVYLSAEGVRSVAAHGNDKVVSESIVVDGPQGQLHHWQRAAGGRPGRPFELELQSRLAPDVHLSVFASCQTAAACGTAETMLRSIRVVKTP